MTRVLGDIYAEIDEFCERLSGDIVTWLGEVSDGHKSRETFVAVCRDAFDQFAKDLSVTPHSPAVEVAAHRTCWRVSSILGVERGRASALFMKEDPCSAEATLVPKTQAFHDPIGRAVAKSIGDLLPCNFPSKKFMSSIDDSPPHVAALRKAAVEIEHLLKESGVYNDPKLLY